MSQVSSYSTWTLRLWYSVLVSRGRGAFDLTSHSSELCCSSVSAWAPPSSTELSSPDVHIPPPLPDSLLPDLENKSEKLTSWNLKGKYHFAASANLPLTDQHYGQKRRFVPSLTVNTCSSPELIRVPIFKWVWIVFKDLTANNAFVYLFITQVRLRFYFQLGCLLFILSLGCQKDAHTDNDARTPKINKKISHASCIQLPKPARIRDQVACVWSNIFWWQLDISVVCPKWRVSTWSSILVSPDAFSWCLSLFLCCLHLLGCLQHCLFPQGAQCDFSLCSKTKCLLAKTSSVRSSSWNHWISIHLHVYTVRFVKA